MLYDPSKKRPTDVVSWQLWLAADYIERHGWYQHAMRNHRTGRVCAAGAILEVVGGDTTLMDAPLLRLSRYLNGDVVQEWNDRQGRTKEEVVAALRSAALYGT